jgi:hypothetical protein
VGGQKLRGLYYDPNRDGADGHVRLVGDSPSQWRTIRTEAKIPT